MEVAIHLGNMSRMLRSGDFDENDLSNVDETHFIFNMDDGRYLRFAGDSEVKYANTVSCGESMTTVVRLSGGRDARIEMPFTIFTNRNRSYPIRGVPYNIPGVAYRSGPKGWME